MRVQFVVEQGFRDKFGKAGSANVSNMVNRIIVHSNSFFAHSSSPTKFKLEALPTLDWPDKYQNATGPGVE